ncbi:hypothetical protein ADIARSV_3276 [Arcticibacter svalbardensis MN12-7]|uniref:Uncharacterized protein n=1 Tax=Arcticibacter svalbardensis MN12-7 TaxID=1150600 RepID=R9GPB3_9SPHI|nr:hypothetical protein ADIARSV_3276 [Arcticibacter svalbardensis MN12-7]
MGYIALPVAKFDWVTSDQLEQGYMIISKVEHPIARMAFPTTTKRWSLPTKLLVSLQEDRLLSKDA